MKIREAVSLVMLAFVIQACASTTQGPHSRATTNQSLLTPPPVSEFASAESVNEEAPKATPKRPPLPSLTGTIQSGLMGFNPQTKGAKPTFPEKDKQKISFLFEKVDVSEVTSQIFGDYLKLNYVLDPTLQGRISFYLEGEFSKEDLFQMITRAYAANNISVVPRNGVYYIQPLQRSASSSLPLASEFTLKTAAGGAQPVIVIYRLLYMDVKQAINTIKFFLTPGRPITSDSMTNSVIFVDDTDNARTIVDILKSLDINILQEVSMEIIPLQAITAQDAVQGMESLLGKLNLVKESSIKNNIAFIPLQNFGGVLVLAQSAELLRTAKYWLTALDVHSQESGEQIYVYFVKNGLAGDLASILTQAYGLEAPSGGGRLDQQVVQSGRPFGSSSGRSSFGSGTSGFGGSSLGGSSSSSRSGGYGTSGSSLSGGGFGSSSSSMGTTGSSKPSTSSSQSRSGGRGNVRSTGAYTRVSEGDVSGTSLTGDVAIIPDEVNNAIVIRSNAADYARIKKTMETLDILPRAVLIEVLIAEVALNKNIEYGLEWFFKDIGMDIAGKDGKFTAAHGAADSTNFGGRRLRGAQPFLGKCRRQNRSPHQFARQQNRCQRPIDPHPAGHGQQGGFHSGGRSRTGSHRFVQQRHGHQ